MIALVFFALALIIPLLLGRTLALRRPEWKRGKVAAWSAALRADAGRKLAAGTGREEQPVPGDLCFLMRRLLILFTILPAVSEGG